MIDPITLKTVPVTTPAQLRRAAELLTEALDTFKTFQSEIEAAGEESDTADTVSDLISALEEPQWLTASLPDLASDLAADFEDGRTPDELIYSVEDFAWLDDALDDARADTADTADTDDAPEVDPSSQEEAR